MTGSEGFTDPWRSGSLSMRDVFARRYKGASGGAAIREQRLAREQSAQQFAQQMALQQKQFDAAQAIKPVTFAPASPLATGEPDTYNAGLDAKRAQRRRFGPSATRIAPVAPQAGVIPMGAVPKAA